MLKSVIAVFAAIAFYLVVIGGIIASIIGWVLNIIALFSAEGWAEIAVRVVGIPIAIIGAVLGYVTI